MYVYLIISLSVVADSLPDIPESSLHSGRMLVQILQYIQLLRSVPNGLDLIELVHAIHVAVRLASRVGMNCFTSYIHTTIGNHHLAKHLADVALQVCPEYSSVAVEAHIAAAIAAARSDNIQRAIAHCKQSLRAASRYRGNYYGISERTRHSAMHYLTPFVQLLLGKLLARSNDSKTEAHDTLQAAVPHLSTSTNDVVVCNKFKSMFINSESPIVAT